MVGFRGPVGISLGLEEEDLSTSRNGKKAETGV